MENAKSSTFQERFIKLVGEKATHEEIAQIVHTSRQNVGNWLSGKTKPDINALVNIARGYNVSTDYLLGLTDIKTNDTDLKAMCECTGLSGEAIIGLLRLKEQCELIAMHYGEHSQLGIMIEEAAELIQAISKMQRYGEPTKRLNYIEELADVSIMAEQLITLLDTTDYERFERFVEYKLNRQMDRIKSENNV